eukprot:scaffold1806_cov156-Amphora_coffeaeformis.AAC.4
MALPRISTILGVTIVASLSFNIVLYATRFTSSSVLALRGMDPLEEELGLQLLYFSCHQIEDKADCLGQCHWCGDGGGIYDETPSGERFACVPTRNPCADPKKRTTVTKNEQQKSQRQQQHVIIPAKDLPNVNPHDMQALQRLVSNKKNNRVHKQQSSVEIKANDLPNLDPNEVDTLRHLMDPQSESPRAPLVKGQSDMQEHPFKKQRMMPKKVITIPEIDRSEARARNVERFQARKAEYNAMTESEQAQLLVRHNTDFYRYRYYSPVISEKFKLMFVPIPKVACTQWLQLFRRMAGQENWQERVGGLPYTPDINGLTYLSDYNLTEATNILKSSEWTRFVKGKKPELHENRQLLSNRWHVEWPPQTVRIVEHSLWIVNNPIDHYKYKRERVRQSIQLLSTLTMATVSPRIGGKQPRVITAWRHRADYRVRRVLYFPKNSRAGEYREHPSHKVRQFLLHPAG